MNWVANRYMFDTSAINALYRASGEDEMLIYNSKSRGFEYYFTETQLQEIENNINSKEFMGLEVVSRAAAMRAIRMLKLVTKIQKAYVGRIATLTHNRWILDGTFELLSDDEKEAAKMYSEILNNNPIQHYNDAIIALTGIANGCTIVVNDKRFKNAVNHHFDGRAISYDEFLSRLR